MGYSITQQLVDFYDADPSFDTYIPLLQGVTDDILIKLGAHHQRWLKTFDFLSVPKGSKEELVYVTDTIKSKPYIYISWDLDSLSQYLMACYEWVVMDRAVTRVPFTNEDLVIWGEQYTKVLDDVDIYKLTQVILTINNIGLHIEEQGYAPNLTQLEKYLDKIELGKTTEEDYSYSLRNVYQMIYGPYTSTLPKSESFRQQVLLGIEEIEQKAATDLYESKLDDWI